MLDSQISIFSLDTGNFYSNHEARLHWRNHTLRAERSQLVNGGVIKNKEGKVKRKIIGTKEIESQLYKHGFTNHELNLFLKEKRDRCELVRSKCKVSEIAEIEKLLSDYIHLKGLIAIKNKAIKKTKDSLLLLLENKVDANIKSNGKHHIRVLNENQVSKKNIISVFDSFFTRTIGAEKDTFCEDFMVVQVYYFSIIKDLIYHGFTYKGEKYIYFTSSAGQIRNKKTVFIKESVWKRCEKTIMCGLTIEDINRKGGNNPN